MKNFRSARREIGKGAMLLGGAALVACTFVFTGCGGAEDTVPGEDLAVGVTEQALASSQSGNSMHLNVQGLDSTDTAIASSDWVDVNYGAYPGIPVGITGTLDYRGLLWFNTWRLPRPAAAGGTPRITVSGASLTLENLGLIGGSKTSIALSIATPSTLFAEGTSSGSGCANGATWLKPNCALATTWTGGSPGAALTTANVLTAAGSRKITIPPAAIAAYNAAEYFPGWLLRDTTSADPTGVMFLSREGFAAGKGAAAPQLEVDYKCAAGYQNDLVFGPGGCTGDAGKACRDGGMCESGVCSNGACKGDNERACTSNGQCVSGTCVGGFCAGFRAVKAGSTSDTFVQSNAGTTVNHGGAGELLNGIVDPATGKASYMSLVQIALPTLPPPVVVGGVARERIVIDDIKLKMTQVFSSYDGTVITANLRRIGTPWVEGTDTTQTTCTGGATNARPSCKVATSWPSNWKSGAIASSVGLDQFYGQKVWSFPATELAELRKSTYAGYLLELASPGPNFRNFAATEGKATWGGPWPTLVVDYHCAPGYTKDGRFCNADLGSPCGANSDCENFSCIDGICCTRSCNDVQCGTLCGKDCGKTCAGSATCQANSCVDHCSNGVKDGDEVHVDCGGSCNPCVCDCTDSECGMTSSCGTTCGTCPSNETCFTQTLDYKSWGVCVPHCGNGHQDMGETAVDCGGSCGPCLADCSCVGLACGATDGCGNTCTQGSCPQAIRPAASTLPVSNNVSYFGAQQAPLGTLNGQWVGVQGNSTALQDRSGAWGCNTATAKDAYYYFTLCNKANVTIDTTGSAWAASIGLFKGSEVSFAASGLLAPCASPSGTTPATISTTLPAGDYMVAVSSNSTTSSGAFNLYIRDDLALTPTCGGAGVLNTCGVRSGCAHDAVVLPALQAPNSPQSNIGDGTYRDSNGNLVTPPQVGKKTGALKTDPDSTNQSLLFCDGGEQGVSRWTTTGSVVQSALAAQADPVVTGRASSSGFRMTGTSTMQVTLATSSFTDLRLKLSAKLAGVGLGGVYVEWSYDGRTWLSLTSPGPSPIVGTAWAAYDYDMTVPGPTPASGASLGTPPISTVSVRLRFVPTFGTATADIDNLRVISKTGNAKSLSVNSTSPTGWSACTPTGATTTLPDPIPPPTAADSCPPIQAPCSCPADPTTIRPSASCATDLDCQPLEECAKIPMDLCSVITNGSATCPSDGAGYLLTKYCAKRFSDCAGAPALGCFSGATPVTVGSVSYNACTNPAEEPCKQIYECPTVEMVGTTNKSPQGMVEHAPAVSAAPVTLSSVVPVKFEVPTDAGFDDCHQDMVNTTSGSTTPNVNNAACAVTGGKFDSLPLPPHANAFSNCDNSENSNEVKGIGNSGSKPAFDIDFDPQVYKHVMVKDLLADEADMKVDAGLDWAITPTVWHHSFTILGVNARAGVDRCELDMHADVTLLDQDIDVSQLVDGVLSNNIKLPSTTLSSDIDGCRKRIGLPLTPQALAASLGCSLTTKGSCDAVIAAKIGCSDPTCVPSAIASLQTDPRLLEDLFAGFSTDHTDGFALLANQAKKALTDARRVQAYWDKSATMKSPTIDLQVCDAARRIAGDSSLPCDVSVVNAFINRYNNLLKDLVGRLPAGDIVGQFGNALQKQQGAVRLLNEHVPYKVLAVSFAFPVGPLSALLEISAGGYWGVGGSLDYEFNPQLLLDSTVASAKIATANANLTPEAGAWAQVFVGVGVGLGPLLGAYVGVQGQLELIGISLPITGSASLSRSQVPDARQAGAEWVDGLWNGQFGNATPTRFGGQHHNTWSDDWSLKAHVDLHALDGQIDLAARIKLLFYTIQISKTIARWDGYDKSVDIVKPITKSVALGTFSVDIPFSSLSTISPVGQKARGLLPDANIIQSLGIDPWRLSFESGCRYTPTILQ